MAIKDWVTYYSTYFLSRGSKNLKVLVICENKNCNKKFITNNGRKRCSKKCARIARKQNKLP